MVRDIKSPNHVKNEATYPPSLNAKHRSIEPYPDGPRPDGAILTSHYDYGSGSVPTNHDTHPLTNIDIDVTIHSRSVNDPTKESNLKVTLTVEDTLGTLGTRTLTKDGGTGPDHRSLTGTFDPRTKHPKEHLDDDRNTGISRRESALCCVKEKATGHRELYD